MMMMNNNNDESQELQRPDMKETETFTAKKYPPALLQLQQPQENNVLECLTHENRSSRSRSTTPESRTQEARTRGYLQELPSEVLFKVCCYLQDPLDVCRLAATSRTFKNLLLPGCQQPDNDDDDDDDDNKDDHNEDKDKNQREPEFLWQQLYERRWGTNEWGNEDKVEEDPENTTGSNFFQRYQGRQELEKEALLWVQSLCYRVTGLEEVSNDDDYESNNDKLNIPWERLFAPYCRQRQRRQNSNCMEHQQQQVAASLEEWTWSTCNTDYRKNVLVLLWHWCQGHWDYPTLARRFPILAQQQQREKFQATNTSTATKIATRTAAAACVENVPYRVRLLQCFAAHVLDWMHYTNVLEKWQEIVVTAGDDESYHSLEDGVLLLAESLLSMQEILQEDPTDRRQSMAGQTKQQLDDMAGEFKTRLQHYNIPYGGGGGGGAGQLNLQNLKQCFTVLNQLLFDDYGLQGNPSSSSDKNNNSNVENMLLHKVFAGKESTALTLCVLYKLICSRVGIHVNIMALATTEGGEHFVLGVPLSPPSGAFGPPGRHSCTTSTVHADAAFFIDVFHQGHFLSWNDLFLLCPEEKYKQGFPLQQQQPLTTLDIWTRMSQNLLLAVAQQHEQQTTLGGVHMACTKIQKLLHFVACPDNHNNSNNTPPQQRQSLDSTYGMAPSLLLNWNLGLFRYYHLRA